MGDSAEIRKLEEKGYTFTGVYNFDKRETVRRAAEIKAAGNKVRVVYSPGSKYSRSGRGGGWSAYWIESEANKAIRLEKARESRLWLLRRNLEEAETKVAEIKAEIASVEAQ